MRISTIALPACMGVGLAGCGFGLDAYNKAGDSAAIPDVDDDEDDGGDDGDDGGGGTDTGLGGVGSGSGGSGSGGSGSGGSGSGGSGSGGSSGSSGSSGSGGSSSGSGGAGGSGSSGSSGSSGGGSGGDPDNDGDGYPASYDCDDSDPTLNWDDYDGDIYTTCDGDCDDYDTFTYPGAGWREASTACMTDLDRDGYGDLTPALGVTSGTDCDDADASVYPGAVEVAGDGVDQDCDGVDAGGSGSGGSTGGGGTTAMTVSGTGGTITDSMTNYFYATVSGCSTVATLQVNADLYHTYLGDLLIYIQEPSGLQALLYDGSVDWNFTDTTLTIATPVTGATGGTGSWALIIDDTMFLDDGTLNSWSLDLTCY